MVEDPKEKIDATTLSSDNLVESLKKVGIQVMETVSTFDSFSTAFETLSKLNGALKNYANGTGPAVDGMKALVETTGDLFTMFTKFKGFDSFQQQGLAATGSMNAQFKELSERFGGFGGALEKIASKSPELANKLATMGVGLAKDFLEGAEYGAKLESGMIGLAASTGNLNDMFDNQGTSLKNVSNLTEQYAQKLANTVIATHMSGTQVTEYVMALGKVSEAMNQNVEITKGGATTSTTGLIAVTKLAALAHIGAADAAAIMSTAYENLANPMGKVTDSTQKGVNMFALMIDMNTKLGLRFEDTKKFLTDVSQEFKFVGDNTEAATRVMGTFVGALRDTGLSAKASMDIVQGMVKSVGELSTGTKAFLSIRSGGAGGLQGSFQVDRLIREGKTDEVIQMMTRSLRQQMGGRIVGLEEADKSPSSAAQFYRQRALLQSGAFGSLVGKGPQGDAQANRLLDAMSKGQLTGAAGMLGGKGEEANAAVSQAVDRGTEIQERQVGLLSEINNGIDALVMQRAVVFNEDARSAMGTGNTGVNSIAERTREEAELAGKRATNATGKPAHDYRKTADKDLALPTTMIGAAISATPQVAEKVGGITKEKINNVKNVGLMVKDVAAQAEDERQVAAGGARSLGAIRNGRSIPTPTTGRAVPAAHPMLPRMTAGTKNEHDFHAIAANVDKAFAGRNSPRQMTAGVGQAMAGHTKETAAGQSTTLKIEVSSADGSGVKVRKNNEVVADLRSNNNASFTGTIDVPHRG